MGSAQEAHDLISVKGVTLDINKLQFNLKLDSRELSVCLNIYISIGVFLLGGTRVGIVVTLYIVIDYKM